MNGFELILFSRGVFSQFASLKKTRLDGSPSVHALYDRSKTITTVLGILFAIDNAVMIGTLVFLVPELRFDNRCVLVFIPLKFGLFAYILFSSLLYHSPLTIQQCSSIHL
jgi:hypothetical protein